MFGDSEKARALACPSRYFADMALTDSIVTASQSEPHEADIQLLDNQTDACGRQTSSPSPRSLVELPNEILSRILEESDVNPLELRTLSHTMLEIVTHSPRLWTTIRPNMSLARIKLSLVHSRERTLDVNLALGDDEYSRKLLSLFQEHHWARVERLTIMGDRSLSSLLNTAFIGLHMSRLRYFKLEYNSTGWHLQPTPSDGTFYETMSAPLLQSMYTSCEIPLPIAEMRLEELTIKTGYRLSLPLEVPRIFKTLKASQMLQRLTLHFTLRVEDDEGGDIVPVELPHVTVVDFAFLMKGYYLELTPWKTIVHNLVLPNVEELRLQTEFFINGNFNFTELASLFVNGSVPRYPKLHTLTFHTEHCDEFDLILPTIFRGLPNLQHFTLDVKGYGFLTPIGEELYIWEQGGQSFPRLETICLRGWEHERGLEFFDFFLRWLLDRVTIAYPLTNNNDPHKRMTLTAVQCAEHVKPYIDAWRTRYDVEWCDE